MRPLFQHEELEKQVLQFMEEIKQTLKELAEKQVKQDFYSAKQAAKLLGLSPYTICERLREGRLRGHKKLSGRGLSKAKEWAIPNEEIARYRREGLLPPPQKSGTEGGAAA